jgi:hypothetical protein
MPSGDSGCARSCRSIAARDASLPCRRGAEVTRLHRRSTRLSQLELTMTIPRRSPRSARLWTIARKGFSPSAERRAAATLSWILRSLVALAAGLAKGRGGRC